MWDVVHLIEAMFLPAISGGDWLDVTVRTRVEDGVGTAVVAESSSLDIDYGLLSSVTRVDGWPSWAGQSAGGSALLTTDATFDADALTLSAAPEGPEGYLVTISGGLRLALDWTSVVRNHIPVLQAAVERLYQLVAEQTDVLSSWVAALGLDDDLLETLKASAVGWYEWWIANFYEPLNDILVPQVDFAFEVEVSRDGFGSWTVRTTPDHDAFPRYELELVGTDSLDGVELYDGPDNLISSVEGPFALAAPITVPGVAEIHTVDPEWFDSWS